MNKLFFFVVLLNCTLLFACKQNNNSSIANETVQNKASINALPVSHERKPGAQISLISDNIVELVAGKTTRIDILLNAQMNNDSSLHVELNPGDGLQLIDSEKSYDFLRTADGRYNLGVDVNAVSNGRYYLNINATISTGDISSSRSLAVIVQVGSFSSSVRSEKVLKTKSSENIISLPAQEHIIHQ